MTDQTFDIIVYGASSFVGQILTRYMHDQFTDGSVSWAIAGRSESKLKKLSEDTGLSDIEILLADANDELALKAMCARAKVVISTVALCTVRGYVG